MPAIARVTDTIDHGGVIAEGSPTRKADGLAVARLGDNVVCNTHGRNPITTVMGQAPTTDSRPDAHVGAKTACGATIITGSPTVSIGVGGTVSSIIDGQVFTIDAQEHEAISQEDEVGHAGGAPGSATPDGAPAASVLDTAPPAAVAGSPPPIDCKDIGPNTKESDFLTTHFTLGMLTSGAGASTSIAARAQLGLTREQIICNLRQLCINILEPLYQQYGHTFIVYSGFRAPTGTPYHPRGNAADLHFFTDTSRRQRVSHADLLIRAQWIKNNTHFTQLLIEFAGSADGWIHAAFSSLPLVSSALDVGHCFVSGAYRKGLGIP